MKREGDETREENLESCVKERKAEGKWEGGNSTPVG